ncbi:DUF3606 domain-containing protein [Chryseobacterium indologenes]|uniref:DUF3606 domain-containing protein n=1 Tax=Chryseobacterium indologenes TaxID=253 RepID=UPI0003E0761C|nr:DUF3606 domain-containing protein [Chryseobacterium indologenes]ASE61530.1 DUF3606 domain-containing protein [Chryseobacterium indologenes]QPQ51689.1 DUF3606 domain-containing protein [Chryseobacterium indologenes]TLX23664.1 DUF3606 domain-containing protein [Chryseobacterium indologenes]SFI76632.1 Protein of unknown function [Chryseobacterium indologenes]SUX50189.1 Protein of uncharacterised function (DUF3606) [Chryseobacterium indologenes]
MSDDLNKKRPQDASKINIHEVWEVQYWTRTLGVTEEQLKRAVQAVGTSVADVRRYLGK